MFHDFIIEHNLPKTCESIAQQHFVPRAEFFWQRQQKLGKPFVGINGCQGSGKSTLSAFIAYYLTKKYQLNIVVLSLDDFYLDQQSRKTLSAVVHPLLKTRGVPGTHDTERLARTLANLTQADAQVELPRFSKATDNPAKPEQVNGPIDLVLLEGWCWGVEPQSPAELSIEVNQLERDQDGDRLWREYVNRQIQQNYQPLYQQMNYWLFLQAPSFNCVYQWRQQQEDKLIAKNDGVISKGIMSPAQVKTFVQLFQRLTEHALNTMPAKANVILQLDSNRQVTKILNSL
jgi:D-glycerate 3-kinase